MSSVITDPANVPVPAGKDSATTVTKATTTAGINCAKLSSVKDDRMILEVTYLKELNDKTGGPIRKSFFNTETNPIVAAEQASLKTEDTFLRMRSFDNRGSCELTTPLIDRSNALLQAKLDALRANVPPLEVVQMRMPSRPERTNSGSSPQPDVEPVAIIGSTEHAVAKK